MAGDLPTESPTPNPRDQLRNMVADALHRAGCNGCRTGRGGCGGVDDVDLRLADAVTEIFPYITPREVRVRDDGTTWEPMAATPTHVEFELRSVPTPAAKRPGEAGSQNASKSGGTDV